MQTDKFELPLTGSVSNHAADGLVAKFLLLGGAFCCEKVTVKRENSIEKQFCIVWCK